MIIILKVDLKLSIFENLCPYIGNSSYDRPHYLFHGLNYARIGHAIEEQNNQKARSL